MRRRWPVVRRWLVDEKGYRDLWNLLITVLAVWAVVVTYSTSANNRDSLCALRADLEQRVLNGRAFLNSHPEGAFGFSRAAIEKSIADQRRTIRALSSLECPETPPQ